MKIEVKNIADLKAAIAELELIAATQKNDLQKTYGLVAENLKPVNLVKSGIRTVFSGELKSDLVSAVVGLGTGFLSRKLVLGKSRGFLGKTAGMALEWGMAALVSKNAVKIKEKAGELIDKVFRRNKLSANHFPAKNASPTVHH